MKKTKRTKGKAAKAKRKEVSPRGIARAEKKAKRAPKPTGHSCKTKTKPKPATLLARAGGNATSSGVTYQATVGAIVATQLLAKRALDPRLELGGAKPIHIRFESEAPIDDIAVETDNGGWVLVQAKNTLTNSAVLESEVGKTAAQIVRQWMASSGGTGAHGWDRPLDSGRDRFVIAAGPGSSGTLVYELAKALRANRAPHSAALPAKQKSALATFQKLLEAAWKALNTRKDPASIAAMLRMTTILPLNAGGADRSAAVEMMAHVAAKPSGAASAFTALERACQALMNGRLGADAGSLRQALADAGTALKAPPAFEADVARLRAYSAEVVTALSEFERIRIDGKRIAVPRACTAAVARAARDQSLLIIGEPGAGKSAVVNGAAAKLRAKNDVIQLAVDRLQVDTIESLSHAIGLTHPLVEVLKHWPGNEPVFLFIDALDATRGGRGEAVFRTLIAAVLALPSNRWRVIASIRSFDLRVGETFREMFKGRPADPAFSDTQFSDVRHINIPRWSPDELAHLLAKAPSLAMAIQRGGAKLHDLALVPFNTRLLAELITGGAAPDAFGSVGSQIELLALYWRKRVAGLGSGAEVCLRALVAEMVGGRTLQAAKMTGAAANATALDGLLQHNVLVPVPGDRNVAFRHHILFDYAASRVFIDTTNLSTSVTALREDYDLALMLGPALSFALQEMWVNGDANRAAFWKGVIAFAGEAGSNPIARSVAARMAAELPQTGADIAGLVALFSDPLVKQVAFNAVSHIIGALQVHADEAQIPCTPWSGLAGAMAGHIEALAWPLRSLLTLLVTRANAADDRNHLGAAARALLAFTISPAAGGAARLVPIAIDLVADTYGTDAAASRTLFAALVAPERMAQHAHEDIPAVARKAQVLMTADPEFLIRLYRIAFGHQVAEDGETNIGGSRILALRSNKKQDYKHAKWQLQEVVPQFLKLRPDDAVRAICAALEGYGELEKTAHDPPKTVAPAGAAAVTLIDDHSYIWAHDPEDPHAHASNSKSIIGALKKALETQDESAARQLASSVIAHAKVAVLWSRLFLAASKRPDVLGSLVWPYASARPFLLSENTRKYAIDAVAAFYTSIDAPARERFESDIMDVAFPGVENPARARVRFLATVFGAIGAPLVTQAAKDIVAEAQAARISVENRRPFQITTSDRGAPEPYWFLERKGVDVDAPSNVAMLKLVEAAETHGNTDAIPPTPSQRLATLQALASGLETAVENSVSPQIIAYAEDTLLRSAAELARQKDNLRADPTAVTWLAKLATTYLLHARPDASGKREAGPRSSATEIALRLCAVDPGTADALFPKVEASWNDGNSDVRFAVAHDLGYLWEFRRADMWALAKRFVVIESDPDVLQAFVDLLRRALHSDPAKTEELVIKLLPRARALEGEKSDRVIDTLGSIIGVLWLRYERTASRACLDEWLADPATHLHELDHAVFKLRDIVVKGYATQDAEDLQLQKNAQALAAETADKMAATIAPHLSAPTVPLSAEETERISAAVRVLDHVGDQLYFSSGAFQAEQKAEETGLIGLAAKRAFLDDMHATLWRIGDVASPHTLYYLIDLLDKLIPADPPRVFDLVAHALLSAGRPWGFQMESLGVDRFVKVVGVFLADHREIFSDKARRQKLVECLDVFVEVGWPSARKLLYRLPELL